MSGPRIAILIFVVGLSLFIVGSALQVVSRSWPLAYPTPVPSNDVILRDEDVRQYEAERAIIVDVNRTSAVTRTAAIYKGALREILVLTAGGIAWFLLPTYRPMTVGRP